MIPTDKDYPYWLADKICAFGDFGKDVANTLRKLDDSVKNLELENAKLRELVPGGGASGRDGGLSDWVGKWIPVNHYLPAHNQTVLVWRDGGLLSIFKGSANITTFRLLSTGPAWECDINDFLPPSSLRQHVTHWMPLPTRPTTDSFRWD